MENIECLSVTDLVMASTINGRCHIFTYSNNMTVCSSTSYCGVPRREQAPHGNPEDGDKRSTVWVYCPECGLKICEDCKRLSK